MADSDWVDDHDGWVDDPPAPKKHWYDISPEGVARGAIDALPVVGGIGGGVLGAAAGPVGSVGGAGLGYAGGKELADVLKNRLLGDQATSVNPLDQAKRVGGNLAEGAAMEMGGQATGKLLGAAGSGLSKAVSRSGERLGSAAEKLAVNSTGATGAQAAKFDDRAGRELLDRGLVKFGDNAENIAGRVGKANSAAGDEIQQALEGLDQKGVTASVDNVVGVLKNKIQELSKVPGNEGTINQVQKQIDNLVARGESNVPVSIGEQAKRNFQGQVNYFSPEAEKKGATHVADAFRKEVEGAAMGADPALADKFTEAKKTYGLLAPIEEAASRRASTQNQSPFGGLGDWVAGGAGGAAGGGIGATASVAAKRALAPRVTSSLAVTSDKISKALMKSPQMSALFQKNPAAFQSLVGQMEKKMTGSTEAPMQQPFHKTAGDDGEYTARNFEDTSGKDAILQKTQGSKYGQVMQNAAKNGDQAIAAAHFILQSRDPEYRKLMGVNEDEDGQN